MSFDEQVRNSVLDQGTRVVLPALATATDITTAGRTRVRRRRGALAAAGVLVMMAAIIGVGTSIDRTDPVNELRSSDGNQDWLLAVPFAFAVTDDGFVGVSQGVDQPLPLVVVRSDDGVAWEPVEDGRLDEWPAIPESAGPTGFTVGDDTVHLVRAWAEAGETDEDDERGDVAQLNVSTARFDLETQEWTLDTQLDVVELDVPGRSVNTVDVAWSPGGLLVDVSVISNPFGQLISERDADQAEVCAAFGAADNSVRLRRCGSTEIEQIELPQPAANLRSRASVVIFAPLSDSFTVVRDPSYDSIGDNAPYMFDGGVGLTMQSASSSDDPTGETVDGIEWTNTWGPISRVFTAAARGDERIAVDAPTVSRLTPADPIRGLWYSATSAPGDRVHVVVDAETWEEIAGNYAMTPEALTEANPAIELPVTTGVEVTIPDMDPSERNWRSIDLQSAFGSTDMSDMRFRTVAAGDAGFVVVATTTPQWQPLDLDETTPFTIETDDFIFEGETPFGPATVSTVDGQLLEQWDHFEAARPDLHGAIDLEARTLVIDTGDSAVSFDLDEWLDVTLEDSVIETEVLYSRTGTEWESLVRVDGLGSWLVVDETGVVGLRSVGRFPLIERFDFPVGD